MSGGRYIHDNLRDSGLSCCATYDMGGQDNNRQLGSTVDSSLYLGLASGLAADPVVAGKSFNGQKLKEGKEWQKMSRQLLILAVNFLK